MRHRRLLVVAALLAGCGAAPVASGSTTPVDVAHASVPPIHGETGTSDEQTHRIRELESRLALRSAEVSDLRGELEEASVAPREVVRIAAPPGCDEDAIGEAADEGELATADDPPSIADEPERRGAPRPMLRLYGTARAAADGNVMALPGPEAPSMLAPPPRVAGFDRLPAMGIPGLPDAVPAIPNFPISIAPEPFPPLALAPPIAIHPPSPADDPAFREYQVALGHVEARRWDEAFAALERFTRVHADHPYADNAMYWQGEVLYARREYRRAMETLEALVARYPGGNKVPDALLRIGFCLQRLGDHDRARGYFRRVREQYPETVPARLASREET